MALTTGRKPPEELLRRSETAFAPEVADAISGRPSPLKSPSDDGRWAARNGKLSGREVVPTPSAQQHGHRVRRRVGSDEILVAVAVQIGGRDASLTRTGQCRDWRHKRSIRTADENRYRKAIAVCSSQVQNAVIVGVERLRHETALCRRHICPPSKTRPPVAAEN